jgi:hypothetical protein
MAAAVLFFKISLTIFWGTNRYLKNPFMLQVAEDNISDPISQQTRLVG